MHKYIHTHKRGTDRARRGEDKEPLCHVGRDNDIERRQKCDYTHHEPLFGTLSMIQLDIGFGIQMEDVSFFSYYSLQTAAKHAKRKRGVQILLQQGE
jgi:hypothetical protein